MNNFSDTDFKVANVNFHLQSNCAYTVHFALTSGLEVLREQQQQQTMVPCFTISM